MFLKRVSVAGWRSFAPTEGVAINDLGSVSLLVGPNNVGKSNIGRLLVRIRDILIITGSLHFSPWKEGSAYYLPLSQKFNAEEIDHWLREEQEIKIELDIFKDYLGAPHELPEWLLTGDAVRFHILLTRSGNAGTLSVVPVTSKNLHVITLEGTTYRLLQSDGTYTEQVSSGQEHWHRSLALAACRCLATSIIEIKPLRDPSREGVVKTEVSTDGGDIIKKLLAKQNDKNQQSFWTNCKSDLEAWLEALLGERDLRIEINESGFWVDTKRGGRRFRCALPDLGAGVSEIVIVLAYLRLSPTHPLLVIIDEPEAHLHPAAAVELVKIINNHLPGHQLLISTHSTSLIDAVTPAWKIFRAYRGEHGGTAIEEINTTKTELALLADLGIRPSQLFLASVVLWVEGPSDVQYWTALLNETDSKLVAGRDFAFVTYGGASSSHLDLDEDDEKSQSRLVEVLKVAHRSVIICDRDKNTDEEDRSLVQRLFAAAKNIPQHVRIEKSIGREIENSIKSDVLLKVLEEFRPKRFLKPEKISIIYEPYVIDVDQAFDVVVSNAARKHDGTVLTSEQICIIKDRLNQKKNQIAERIKSIGLKDSVFCVDAVSKAKEMIQWMQVNPSKN